MQRSRRSLMAIAASLPVVPFAKAFRGYNADRQTVFELEALGGVGDGRNDDTNAFETFNRAALVGAGDEMVVLILRRGRTYTTRNPFWPLNIRRLVVHGNGATIK